MRTGQQSNLNQEGVDLARSVGEEMDPFEYIITSGHERAKQTAVAMGYAISEIDETFNTYGKYKGIEQELAGARSYFSNYAEIYDLQGQVYTFANEQMTYILQLLQKIDEGEALLIISHGGIVDFPLLAMLPDEDHEVWGANFSYCEGYRVYVEQNEITRYQILRVDDEISDALLDFRI